MKRKISLIVALMLVFVLALAGCGQTTEEAAPVDQGPTDEAVEVNVSAAASLTDALTEIQQEYAKESNAIIRFNFGSSGALRKQVEEGAPCDLFLSASKDHMDGLEAGGLLDEDTRLDLLANKLTLIASAEKADTIKSYEDMTSDMVGSISIGTPDTVPAGKYAQQALQNLGIYDQVESKVVFAKDVRQVLEYVDTGNVDCGIVYRSDTVVMESGVIVMDLPDDSHDAIVYPAALIKDSAQNEAAAKFFEFLQTDAAKDIFEKYGFTVL